MRVSDAHIPAGSVSGACSTSYSVLVCSAAVTTRLAGTSASGSGRQAIGTPKPMAGAQMEDSLESSIAYDGVLVLHD